MASQVLLHLGVLASVVLSVRGWRCAKYENYFSQQPDYIDCVWDCCGNSFNRHCCAPIGIIVGCSIVGAVVVAFCVVGFVCWWQRRKARSSKGPKLFHNRHHSHYPVAPTSVTRPAPYGVDQGYKAPLGPAYRPPPAAGYRQGPPPPGFRQYHDDPQSQERYRDEKPPLNDDPRVSSPGGYRPGPGSNRGDVMI